MFPNKYSMNVYDVIINGHEKKPSLGIYIYIYIYISRHLVNRKNPLSSCSLSSSIKMGKKSFFIGRL
jgi:hypothetical protein